MFTEANSVEWSFSTQGDRGNEGGDGKWAGVDGQMGIRVSESESKLWVGRARKEKEKKGGGKLGESSGFETWRRLTIDNWSKGVKSCSFHCILMFPNPYVSQTPVFTSPYISSPYISHYHYSAVFPREAHTNPYSSFPPPSPAPASLPLSRCSSSSSSSLSPSLQQWSSSKMFISL